MRNYIILNNKNSNTISGLIIQELAPISKPLQRTQVETIDGRDGDIVTPLGYAAYNKKIKIGLYGTFDINEIIAYFATEGQVIFSNEPDKYYNYQIVDQIDYERLVRYKVATVTMHVQPFKYSATEGTLTVDASDTVSGEGSEIALDNTAEAPFNTLRHKGNATQTTYTGKNLFDKSQASDGWLDYNSNIVAGTTWRHSDYVPITGGAAYTTSGMASGSGANPSRCYYDASKNFISGVRHNANSPFTDTAPANAAYMRESMQTADIDGVQIEAGSSATDYEQYVGGVASPNPDFPQDIHVVTGEQTVKITGKNLFNPHDMVKGRTDNGVIGYADGTSVLDATDTTVTFTTTANYRGIVSGLMRVQPSQTYTFSTTVSVATSQYIDAYDMDGNWIRRITGITGVNATFTTPDNCYGIRISLQLTNAGTCKVTNPQFELSSQATDYEEFKGQSYVIPFGDTYLAAIGDYADEPVKVGDTWYIRRAIGKKVFDGSEAWAISNTGTDKFFYRVNNAISNIKPTTEGGATSNLLMSNIGTPNGVGNNNTIKGIFIIITGAEVRIRYGTEMPIADWKAFLGDTNMHLYYALATPTDEAITDQDLIDALDEFYGQAHSYKGRTHLTATPQGDNAPAVLAVEVGEDNESTVTNAGNTTSRPILTIYGQGDIGVYINDVEVLDIELGDEGYITLDSVEMEAYKDNTANLKNRLVTGDYSKLALNAGANKIRFTGTVTKYEISKYSRWL